MHNSTIKPMFTFYHNPRCSKSRQGLALLEERGIPLHVVRYLETPPDAKTLQKLVKKLGIAPRQLLRKGEEEYKTLALADESLTDQQILDAMSRHPKLIERPILFDDKRAAIGRPPENLLNLL